MDFWNQNIPLMSLVCCLHARSCQGPNLISNVDSAYLETDICQVLELLGELVGFCDNIEAFCHILTPEPVITLLWQTGFG